MTTTIEGIVFILILTYGIIASVSVLISSRDYKQGYRDGKRDGYREARRKYLREAGEEPAA